jgi:hypothetical protein
MRCQANNFPCIRFVHSAGTINMFRQFSLLVKQSCVLEDAHRVALVQLVDVFLRRSRDLCNSITLGKGKTAAAYPLLLPIGQHDIGS